MKSCKTWVNIIYNSHFLTSRRKFGVCQIICNIDASNYKNELKKIIIYIFIKLTYRLSLICMKNRITYMYNPTIYFFPIFCFRGFICKLVRTDVCSIYLYNDTLVFGTVLFLCINVPSYMNSSWAFLRHSYSRVLYDIVCCFYNRSGLMWYLF